MPGNPGPRAEGKKFHKLKLIQNADPALTGLLIRAGPSAPPSTTSEEDTQWLTSR